MTMRPAERILRIGELLARYVAVEQGTPQSPFFMLGQAIARPAPAGLLLTAPGAADAPGDELQPMSQPVEVGQTSHV